MNSSAVYSWEQGYTDVQWKSYTAGEDVGLKFSQTATHRSLILVATSPMSSNKRYWKCARMTPESMMIGKALLSGL